MVTDLVVKRLIRLDGAGTVKAFCDLAVGDLLLIRSLKVVEGKKGLFVSMPREQGKNGMWYDVAVPMTKEATQAMSNVVLEAYEQSGNGG